MTVYGFILITASVMCRLMRPTCSQAIFQGHAWAQACDLWFGNDCNWPMQQRL